MDDMHDMLNWLDEHLGNDDLPFIARALFDLDHENLAGSIKRRRYEELLKWAFRRKRLRPIASMIHVADTMYPRMTIDEIRTLAFDLAIDLERIGGRTTKESLLCKIYCALVQSNTVEQLAAWIKVNRPDIPLQ